jgi:hypothetical protein
MLQRLIANELTVVSPPPPRLRFLQALRNTDTDDDLRAMNEYMPAVGFDKRAFYLSCETLVRKGALRVVARLGSGQPSRFVIADAVLVRQALQMFFEGAKSKYSIEKRFVDLQWMALVVDKDGKQLLKPPKAKLHTVAGLGQFAIISSMELFQENAVLVYMQVMPNWRGEPPRTLEERQKNMPPERLVSKIHINSLLIRTESFWAKRVQNQAESILYRSSMEQCYYETLESLAKPPAAVTWLTTGSFRIENVDAWYAKTFP